jgi:uncharacterized protein
MKLHADTQSALNTVTGYGPGWIEINRQRFEGAILVMPEGPVVAWPVSTFEELQRVHFDAIAERSPELVLMGSGARQRFLHPRLAAALSDSRIGIDVMTTHAACRTYNILMAEGRRVLAVLLPA